MGTNQILEKVAAINAAEAEEKKAPQSSGRQQSSGWVEVESFEDKPSGLGVVITGRDSGPPRFSVQLVRFESNRANKFVSLPCKGANRPIEEVVYLLFKQAREFIEGKLAEAKKQRGDRPRKDKRKDKRGGPRKESSPTGLSELAKRDARKHEDSKFVGKTAKKKDKGKPAPDAEK